ncbi:hypothetical protein L208DRAFT_1339767, partial [Tricholoma matsutake]
YRTNIKNRKNTQGTPLVPLHHVCKLHGLPGQPQPLAKGNPKLKLYYILQGLGMHLAKGNSKRKL